jgi:hypothetical protein
LKRITSLQTLDLSSALANLTALQCLDLSWCGQLQDLSALANLQVRSVPLRQLGKELFGEVKMANAEILATKLGTENTYGTAAGRTPKGHFGAIFVFLLEIRSLGT